ncbi:hypothetical protein V7O62_00820 [Methanolobus sp. ZRKC2]|uniref:hypothetical protein n=1 Tax=Methanolobus sp. ZRKC2 TaxID=3125783 RepID=UPI003247ED4F
MKILKRGLLLAVMLISLALLVGAAAAAPTVEQTVTPIDVSSAGGTFDVSTKVVTDTFEAQGSLRVELPDPVMSGWTISNIEWDDTTFPDYVDGDDFKSFAGSGGVMVGTYYFNYTVTVANPEVENTYDVLTFWEDTRYYGTSGGNLGSRVEDTDQVNVVFIVNELFNGDVYVAPGSNDEDALTATGLSWSSPGFVSEISGIASDYTTGDPTTDSGWAILLNGALADASGSNNVTEGDTLEYYYVHYLDSAYTPDLTNPIATVTINVREGTDVLFDDTVTPEGGTIVDALDDTGLTYSETGGWLNSVEGYSPVWNSTLGIYEGWNIRVNGEASDVGIYDTISHGDFVQILMVNFDPATFTPDLANPIAVVNMTASYPVSVVRTIPYDTIYPATAVVDAENATTMTVIVDITVNENVRGLTLTEFLPLEFSDAEVVVGSLDGGSLKTHEYTGAPDNNKFDVLWIDDFKAGDTKQISYTISVDLDNFATGKTFAYPAYATEGAYVDAYQTAQCAVIGDDEFYIAEGGDWNPWNDPDSDSGAIITNSELQHAIYCWQTGEKAPYTDEVISNSRMQALVHFWLEQTDMPDGVE